jgi:hypothetical protein
MIPVAVYSARLASISPGIRRPIIARPPGADYRSTYRRNRARRARHRFRAQAPKLNRTRSAMKQQIVIFTVLGGGGLTALILLLTSLFTV